MKLIKPENEIEKYYDKNGNIGVIISPDYGAGWSTWNYYQNNIPNEFLLMDKTLVELCLKGKDEKEVKKYLENKFGKITLYLGGWEDTKVFFISPHVRFRVIEYDGKESIEYENNTGWMTT